MKRGILVGVAGVSIVVAGLTGCSSNKSNTSSSGSSSPSAATATASAPGGAGVASGTSATKVTIDGQDQNVQGQVSCVSSNGNVNIGIGSGTTGIGAVLSDADPPAVHQVGLGTVNGVALAYSDTAPGQGSAQATKNGSSYKITGSATGIDTANPTAPVNKAFEIDVACP